jgi:hypothetical protein
VLFQHLFWFFGHPEVYIVALPAFGIVSDLISINARRNIFGYRMMVWAILAIGGLSFIVWAHHMYVSGMNPYFGFFFATTTLIIAVPTALKVYNWVLTLWRGNIHLTVPMLFAIGFRVHFVNGGLTGLFLGNVPVDLPLSDTMFVVAHFHMVMAVSPILVVFGAIYHWYPKVTGRMLNDTMGRWHFWITFVGTYCIYYPMHYLGILGVPRRYYAIEGTDFIRSRRTRSTSGSRSRADRGRRADPVPVQPRLELLQGQAFRRQPVARTTLEWQTPETPPKHGNFGPTLPSSTAGPYDYSVPGRRRGLHPAEPAAGEGRAPQRRSARQGLTAMTTALVVLSVIMAIIVGWLWRRTVNVAPWTAQRAGDADSRQRRAADAVGAGGPRRVHDGGDLAVRALISAYYMRWSRRTGRTSAAARPVDQLRRARARERGDADDADCGAPRQSGRNPHGLIASGAFSFAFLGGQVWAWQQLRASGELAPANPAYAFFIC